jgi:hypothetical protein
VRHEFPSDWARFKKSAENELTINLKQEHYPYWSVNRLGAIKRVEMLARADKSSIKVTQQQNGAITNVGNLVKDPRFGNLRAGTLTDPSIAPIGAFACRFDDTTSIQDIWLALLWGESE